VPAFVHWPKVWRPGTVSTPVHVIDWMPTICALLDIPEEKGDKWDGVIVWPAFLGKEEPVLASRRRDFGKRWCFSADTGETRWCAAYGDGAIKNHGNGWSDEIMPFGEWHWGSDSILFLMEGRMGPPVRTQDNDQKGTT